MKLILLKTSYASLIGICEQYYISSWGGRAQRSAAGPESGHVEEPSIHPIEYFLAYLFSA